MNKKSDIIKQFEPLVTIPQLSKIASTSSATIRSLIDDGRLHAVQMQTKNNTRKSWRIPLSAWQTFVDANQPGRCPCGKNVSTIRT